MNSEKSLGRYRTLDNAGIIITGVNELKSIRLDFAHLRKSFFWFLVPPGSLLFCAASAHLKRRAELIASYFVTSYHFKVVKSNLWFVSAINQKQPMIM
jgi:hypothetical protein